MDEGGGGEGSDDEKEEKSYFVKGSWYLCLLSVDAMILVLARSFFNLGTNLFLGSLHSQQIDQQSSCFIFVCVCVFVGERHAPFLSLACAAG